MNNRLCLWIIQPLVKMEKCLKVFWGFKMNVKKKIIQFFVSEEAQTSTEYILLVAVVALIVLKFRKVATERLNELTDSVFNNASSKIEQDFNSIQ